MRDALEKQDGKHVNRRRTRKKTIKELGSCREEEKRNRWGNRGRVASWLITKRNLSEHHGNALSNIISPREPKRTPGTDSQINAL